MKAQADTLIGVLAGIVIAGIFLAIAYQLVTGFGVEQQKKQAMTSLGELANSIDYACGAGEGSSITVPLKLPTLVKEISANDQQICLVMTTSHCINTKCSINMTPLNFNSTFWQTKARISGKNVVSIELEITRAGDVVSVESRGIA